VRPATAADDPAGAGVLVALEETEEAAARRRVVPGAGPAHVRVEQRPVGRLDKLGVENGIGILDQHLVVGSDPRVPAARQQGIQRLVQRPGFPVLVAARDEDLGPGTPGQGLCSIGAVVGHDDNAVDEARLGAQARDRADDVLGLIVRREKRDDRHGVFRRHRTMALLTGDALDGGDAARHGCYLCPAEACCGVAHAPRFAGRSSRTVR